MESLSNDTLIPIIREKELDVKSFMMGFHEYRTIWTPQENEVLHARVEPTHKNSVVRHLMKGKSGRFAKTIFYL